MVGPSPEIYVLHVFNHDFFGHVRRTVEHHVLVVPSRLFLEASEEMLGLARVADPSHCRHLEALVSGYQGLVDLLKPQ